MPQWDFFLRFGENYVWRIEDLGSVMKHPSMHINIRREYRNERFDVRAKPPVNSDAQLPKQRAASAGFPIVEICAPANPGNFLKKAWIEDHDQQLGAPVDDHRMENDPVIGLKHPDVTETTQ